MRRILENSDSYTFLIIHVRSSNKFDRQNHFILNPKRTHLITKSGSVPVTLFGRIKVSVWFPVLNILTVHVLDPVPCGSNLAPDCNQPNRKTQQNRPSTFPIKFHKFGLGPHLEKFACVRWPIKAQQFNNHYRVLIYYCWRSNLKGPVQGPGWSTFFINWFFHDTIIMGKKVFFLVFISRSW